MEIEKKSKLGEKRKNPHRSASEEPSLLSIGLKRNKKSIDEFLKYTPISISTNYFSRPFNVQAEISFSLQTPEKIELENNLSIIPVGNETNLKSSCQNLILAAHKIMGKEEKVQVKKEKTKTLECKEKAFIEKEFKGGVKDFQALANLTKFSRQQIKNMWIKFQSGKSILGDERNHREKLNQGHAQFILDFFNKVDNFDKTILELYDEMQTHFKFDEKYISYWTLYDYVHRLSLSYKTITYKINRANFPSIKLKRSQIAEEIIRAHLNSYDFIYIDEISFNIELRPNKGWSLIGKPLNTSKPPKSKNYSVIVAMDIKGYLGLKVIKGGVKGPEFISFMFDLCDSVRTRVRTKKVIFFMDNASIHRSKAFMQKFTKFYNVLYNAPYTPQLNPIEFSFSKLKYLVKKFKPNSETDLVRKILKAATEITPKDCAEFIVHSLTFIEKAIDKKDFY